MKQLSWIVMLGIAGAFGAQAAQKTKSNLGSARKASRVGSAQKANGAGDSRSNKKFKRSGYLAQTSATSQSVSGQSVIGAEEVVTKKVPSRFGFMFNNYNEIGIADAINSTNPGESLSTTTLVRGSYRLQDDVSVAIAPAWSHSFGQKSGENANAVTVEDPYVQIAKTGIATLPGGINFSGAYARYYLPFSNASQEAESIGLFRGGMTFEKPLNSVFTLAYDFSPRYYFNNLYAFRRQADNALVQTKSLRLYHYLTLSAAPTSWISFHQAAGLNSIWYNGGEFEDQTLPEKQDNFMLLNSWVGLTVTENFNFALGVYTDSSFNLASRNFVLYPEGESLYYLDAYLVF
ncbi:MAG: hypothetical protein COT74_06765 [Bdellovibrionales bacterium CG10_big_fil_rev_8_21_14_0_10_45_34]|nr:MAG: hypothetical protein COT74_06765 [Bdellovibrionales bacterium CG10_big_fil_rev_8_21_14_0_10_45_34]